MNEETDQTHDNSSTEKPPVITDDRGSKQPPNFAPFIKPALVIAGCVVLLLTFNAIGNESEEERPSRSSRGSSGYQQNQSGEASEDETEYFANLQPGIGGGRGVYRIQTNIGFIDQETLKQAFAEHGHEFGVETPEQYLALAQEVRDRPDSRHVQEDVLPDGTRIKYERRMGAYLAYEEDLTILEFLKPAEGRQYYAEALARGSSSSE